MRKRTRNLGLFIALLLFMSVFTTDSILANDSSADDSTSVARQQPPEGLPNLQGGPEKERVRYPVSNIVLQQRYPETVVLRGPANVNRLALTFDDGPDPRFTPLVLDTLKKYNVKATFFLMGARAKAYPDIVKRMIDEGHIVGNHTYWHPNLVKQGEVATLEREVNQSEEELARLIGYRTKLFRAPYGFLYNELVEKLRDMNYTVVGWSVDSLDWKEEPPETIAYTVLSNVQPGAIILMHDAGDWTSDRTNTIKSLDQIIPTLKEQGFEFVTVPELLKIPYKK
ncbi:polysaccharide deacetylase family protein [Bacillus sp. 31A1R]|uniref:Polysaccharide deacetylase family protein n=1 Tax=Robertmurraya mangrovi TaxID=3098077 RepID=A0ABU5IVX4_9BACI|nr:polysaccharide deacetylase family protein [Bacillus sp. 31A1R]MDZ5471292.1 polysaccharide deacetylase family protein [Bacillus sp. 31A1R]